MDEKRLYFETSVVEINEIPPQRRAGGKRAHWGRWTKIVYQAIELRGEKAIKFAHGKGMNASSYVNGILITIARRLGVTVRVAVRDEIAYVWLVGTKR